MTHSPPGTGTDTGDDHIAASVHDQTENGQESWCGSTIPHDPHTFAYDGETFLCSGDDFPPEEEPDGSDD